jgi:hypothetical protein
MWEKESVLTRDFARRFPEVGNIGAIVAFGNVGFGLSRSRDISVSGK